MAYTPVPVGNQFIRNFPVPLDRDFVFATTAARTSYLTDSATSGIAYTGMIVADLQTNKVYVLNSSMAWQEVGVSVNETFGAANSGMLFKTGNNTFAVRGLSSGNNIVITNPSGLAGNPTIGLSSSITGLSSISGNNNFSIVSYSGISINAGSGTVTVDDLTVTNELNIGGNINISLAAAILATGPVAFSGNPVLISGTTYFNTTPYVGPTGGTLGSTLFPVSLSGHQHGWTEITGFCTGVASCVDTALTVSTGLRSDYNSGTNSLQLALSGQAANIHTLTGTGFVARTGGGNNEGSFAARSIASGANIDVLNGNGVGGNPTVSLASTVTGLTSVEATSVYTNNIYPKAGQNTFNIGGSYVNVTGDLTVANLTVTGTTTTVNSTTITINDPVITVGGTGTLTSADAAFDRGIQLRYWNGAAATGFMGWNNLTSDFVFLSSSTGNITVNEYGAGAYGRVRAGELAATGNVSGNAIYALGETASTLAVFDANKKIVSTGFPTITQLSYVSGVSSNIQTQLDGKAASGVSLTAGNGLTGGGSLSGNLSFNVGAGDGISVGTDDISVNSTVIRTTGLQTITAVKTFTSAPIFSGGYTSSGTINLQVASTSLSGTHYPVFTGDPNSSSQQLYSRTAAQIRTDLGSSSNSGNILVLRDSNGNFTASNITATGFIGYGGAITGLYANNISSGTIPTGVLSGTYNISITGSAYSTTGAVTFKNDGSGDAANTAFSGLVSKTVSYNTIGAPSTTGANASGANWNIGILGNAATVTNGVYTTGTQSINGLKTFGDPTTFTSGLSISNATTGTIAAFDSSKNLISLSLATYPSFTEFSYVKSVTGSIQTQLNNKAASGVSLNAGNGLTGGGSLSGDLSFNIGAGDGISVSADAIAVDITVVRTSGVQSISGIKTFLDRPIFTGGILSSGTSTILAASASSPVGFAVFDSTPTGISQSLVYRTLAGVRSDLGASINTASTLVLRDANGNFSAGSITGTSFVGSGNLLTDVNAYALNIYSNTPTDTETSLVMITGSSTGNYRPFIDTKLKFNANNNTLILENISGLLTGSYLSNSLNIIGATSISGTQGSPGNPASQLLNFIVDGGTP
jgi:hypothetical protein